jgi:hypothetical protein
MPMKNDDALHRLIEGARQIVRVRAAEEPDAPLYLTWFALGHAAVLFYLAARALLLVL